MRVAQSGLKQLPPELLDHVLTFCDFVSLKQSRLVSKHISSASSPHVFEHFHMGLFIYGLEKLACLSKSALAKHVKKFTLHSDLLPDWKQEQTGRCDWERKIDFRPSYEAWLREFASADLAGSDEQTLRTWFRAEHATRPPHPFDDAQLDEAYSMYQRRVMEQQRWGHEQGLELKEYFSALPNLTEAAVQCASPTNNVNTPVWKALWQEILVRPPDWMYSRDYVQWQGDARVGLPALCLLEAVAYRANFAGLKQIEKFTVDSTHRHSYTQVTRVTQSSPYVNLQTLPDGFRNLRELRLHVPYASDSAVTDGPQVANETMTFLRAANELRRLELSYGDADKIEYEAYKSTFALVPLFHNPVAIWPHLRNLSLVASVGAEDFLQFLQLHSKTLRSLEWRDSSSDDCIGLLEQLPHVVRLDYIYLECLWQWVGHEYDAEGEYLCLLPEGTDGDTAHNRAVKGYLLHGGDAMPELDEDDWIANNVAGESD